MGAANTVVVCVKFCKGGHGWLEGIVTSALFTCQTRQASIGSDEQNQ